MKYNTIIAAIIAEAEKQKSETAAHIENSAEALQRHSTETRWRQYQREQITRQQCEQYATERAARRIDKETAAAIELAKAVEAAPEVEAIQINIHWTRSNGGYNPHAQVKVYTNKGTYTASGSAYGGNYDKESAAAMDALNQIPAALKIIYDQRHNNINIYGTALYQAAPKYEGGTGINQLQRILEQSGIMRISHRATATDDYYYFERS